MFFIAMQFASGGRDPFSFYYGPDIPWEALGAFDVAVVEPGHVGRERLDPAQPGDDGGGG